MIGREEERLERLILLVKLPLAVNASHSRIRSMKRGAVQVFLRSRNRSS